MGAEGGIYIFRKEDLDLYPNSKNLVEHIGHGFYEQELDGKKYYTFYYGENVSSYDPFEVKDYKWAEKYGITRKELDDFVNWLNGNALTQWEVWT